MALSVKFVVNKKFELMFMRHTKAYNSETCQSISSHFVTVHSCECVLQLKIATVLSVCLSRMYCG